MSDLTQSIHQFRTGLNILFRLLTKCNQIEPWRFCLNNLLVPGSILILLALAQKHNSIINLPDVRFEEFSVTDPISTQVGDLHLKKIFLNDSIFVEVSDIHCIHSGLFRES